MGLIRHSSSGPLAGNDGRAIRPRWPVGRVRENNPGRIVGFGSLHQPAGVEMMDTLGLPARASVLALVSQRRRESQFYGQRSDFAAVFQRRRIGKFELKGDVLQHPAICQTFKHSALIGFEKTR